MFLLCQYDGITPQVSIYSGQPYNDDIDFGQTGAIVLQLAHDFLDKGYLLFAIYYTSHILIKKVNLLLW